MLGWMCIDSICLSTSISAFLLLSLLSPSPPPSFFFPILSFRLEILHFTSFLLFALLFHLHLPFSLDFISFSFINVFFPSSAFSTQTWRRAQKKTACKNRNSTNLQLLIQGNHLHINSKFTSCWILWPDKKDDPHHLDIFFYLTPSKIVEGNCSSTSVVISFTLCIIQQQMWPHFWNLPRYPVEL